MLSDESAVKHFDRKFRAMNLQSLLRCPKCLNDFTYWPGQSQEIVRRPFLLPCGHNLCENCISIHGKSLECAICFSAAPPTINAKDLNSKFGVNVRDYYELNYHVLGEVISLDYFDRFCSDSVNNSLVISPEKNINLESKCSECYINVGQGECVQCDACFCKRCFDAVHRHSRVLKAHQFQKLNKTKKLVPHIIHVDKEIFKMPFINPCYFHNLPQNIFCPQCKRTKCEKCIAKYHADHPVLPLVEMNLRYADQIPDCMNQIDKALVNIQNSQKVVKNTKQKLGAYASETLVKISKHFGHLHGLLQMAELQVIEKLRESSLPPQMKLNEAMNNLNGYERVLKSLNDLFESKNDVGVPSNIWLRELLREAHSHLEKIPTHLEISKIDTNPYKCIIDVPNNLKKILRGGHIQCRFQDPKINVRFKTLFDTESPISSIPNDFIDSHSVKTLSSNKRSLKQHPKQQVSKKQEKNQESVWQMQSFGQKMEIKKPAKSRKLNTSNSISISISNSSAEQHHSDHMYLESMRTTFSTMSLSKPARKSFNNNGEWFKSDVLVKVRAINSPEDFYVQGINAAQRLQREIEAYAQTPDCRPPTTIEVGRHYLVYHPDENRYYRALVSNRLVRPDTYNIILPDIGLRLPINIKNFREMPKSLESIPYSAVHCTLKQLMPSNGATKWDAEASAFLKQLVQNNPVRVLIVRALNFDPYEVDLITTNNNTNISIRESFLYTGLARARFGNGYADCIEPKQLFALGPQRLPMYEHNFGDVSMIQVLYVESPQEFYVVRHEQESERLELQRSLQNMMDSMGLGELENIYLGRLHLGCALQLKSQWHRVRIEEMLPEGYVLVRLVDNGTCQKVYWDQLFVLPKKFWTPELAIKCRLADVETLPTNGYAWTLEAFDSFKQLISNPKLYMDVIRVHDDILEVSLNSTRTSGESVNIAAQLVKQNHCKSIGESSQLPPSTQNSRLDFSMRKLIKRQIDQATAPITADHGDNRDHIKRTPVYLLYVKDPHEFYMTLPHIAPAILDLKISIQKTASHIYQNSLPRDDWSVGDMCYVHFHAKCDLDFKWHRGQILKIIFSDSDTPKYNILLRDFGEVALDVPNTHMINIDDEHESIANAAVRCHLSGIQPKGGDRWTQRAIDFFKEELESNLDGLQASSEERKLNSMGVVLWASYTIVPGPFFPERLEFVDINDMLVKRGLADKDQCKSDTNYDSEQNDEDSNDSQACIDRMPNLIPYEATPNHHTGTPFEHNDEMPPLEHLKDLNMASPTTGQTSAPLAWTEPRECKKTTFTAYATNVNYECQVFLSLANDKPYLEYMRKLLEKSFKSKMGPPNPELVYVVGQPVVVIYHLDNLLYRGIIEKFQEGQYSVHFVDYGNVETVTPAEMLPYAPFPQLKAMCWLVDIYGVRPKQKEYTIKEIDTVHLEVVMKLSSVRVIEMKGPNNIPMCQIKVDKLDIATMMIESGMAVSTSPQSPQAEKKPAKYAWGGSFKVFDELLHFGEPIDDTEEEELIQAPAQFVDKNNSTIKPPPPKKKFVENCKQINQFDSDLEDFDALALSMVKKNYFSSIGLKEAQRNNGEGNERNVTDDDTDSEVDIEHNEESAEKKHSSERFTLGNMETWEQLCRRIELSQEDRMNKTNFVPLDTSTEFFYNAETCFKPQSLPTGVNEFFCTVDSVLSATELQISPRLSEFTKCDITLFQETRALVEEAAALQPEAYALCLAQYSKDEEWYRATITELHVATKRATVFYIDFCDTETVPYANLKVMPKHLITFPLRSFRVKLHGIKLNTNFGEKTVRQALQACLCKNPFVFAKVYYPLTHHTIRGELSNDGDPNSSSDTIRMDYRPLEVELYENKHKRKVLYQSLIERLMYV